MLGTPVSTRAEGVADSNSDYKSGSITLSLKYKEDGEAKDVKGGQVSLYTVATFEFTDGLISAVKGGQFVNDDEVSDILNKLKDKENSEINELLKANYEIAEDLEKSVAKVKAVRDEKIENGAVSFKDLEPGLYLIVQTGLSEGDRKFNSFLISIPDEEGKFQIDGTPKVEVYTPPTTPPTPPGKPPKGKLPQTGQLWWPVPVMAIAGTVLIAAGLRAKRKQNA